MNILIVLPYYKNSGTGKEAERRAITPLLPLSISYLAAFVPEEHDVTVVDEKVSPIPFDDLFDLVAISATTLNAVRAYEIADMFRSRGSRVVMGGVHASLNTEEALAHCDAVCVGEAEPVMRQIIEDAGSGSLQKTYHVPVADISDIPFARHDLLELDKYWKISSSHKYPILPIFFSRGCPHSCLFCTVPDQPHRFAKRGIHAGNVRWNDIHARGRVHKGPFDNDRRPQARPCLRVKECQNYACVFPSGIDRNMQYIASPRNRAGRPLTCRPLLAERIDGRRQHLAVRTNQCQLYV